MVPVGTGNSMDGKKVNEGLMRNKILGKNWNPSP